MKVLIKPRAQKNIEKIAFYIVNNGYPNNAYKFVVRLENFIFTLSSYPEKFPISRHHAFAKRKFRQAIFEKNYIVFFKEVNNELHIYNILHTRRIR